MRRNRVLWFLVVAGCSCHFAFLPGSTFAQPGARRQTLPTSTQQQLAISGSSQVVAAAEPLRTASDRPVDLTNIRLDLRVDLQKKTVDSKATIGFRSLRPTRTLSLDAIDFDVKHVALQVGQNHSPSARYTHDSKKLVIDLGARLPVGQTGTLEVEYRVQNPKDGLHFFGPSKSQPEAPLLVWSQGESITNRYWIPCIDEPDQRQTTEIVATVPAGFEAVSNGKLVSRQENTNEKTVTFDWRQDIPHPSYLVTLVVGQFDVLQEEWEGIPVLFYVPKARKAEALPTYGRTREMLTFFSQRFGVRYPWAKYAQVTCYQFGGGMENTSATTMTERILLDKRSLLDRTSESIVSHELAHQWWGDMLTCRDWSHTWLNEGFASYAEALWDEHSRGAEEYAYNLYRKAAPAIQGGKSRPIMDLHYTSPDSMFDNRSYPKGAWVLHMLRNRLGDDAFWKGIKRYATENQFQSVETFDLRRALERASDRDLERFFYDWLERPGNPDLEVTTEYLPDSQQVRLEVKQTQTGEAFHIPLKLVLTCAGAREPVVLDEEMTQKELSFRIPLPGALERIDVDPDQAVLTQLKETKPHSLWRAQLLDAPNVSARLRATEHFVQSKAEEDRQLLARAFAGEKFWAVKVELATALGKAGGSVCKEALIQGLQHADARVRRACIDSLGTLPQDAAVATILKEILQKGDPSYAVEGATLGAYARQSTKDALAVITPWLSKPSHEDVLASAALAALGATHDPAVLATLVGWTQPGKPRTLRAAAQRGLAELARSKRLTEPQRQEIMKVLVAALESDDLFARFAVLQALPEMGPSATAALPALEKIMQNESRGRVKDRVKEVADKIRAAAGAASALESTELNQLREQVRRLQQGQDDLRKRLDQFEKSGR
jgi:aminopeptidase N